MPGVATPMKQASPRRARRIWPFVTGAVALGVVAILLLWNWDWFIPIIEARASSALGRRVSIGHLHVALGRQTTVTAESVTVANPDNFQSVKTPVPDLAQIGRLTVTADVAAYVHDGHIVLPFIGVDHPHVEAAVLANGQTNFALKPASQGGGSTPPPSIGTLQITDGTAHVVDQKLRSDMTLQINTRAEQGNEPAAIVADISGTYADQKIDGHFIGGALLTLRDSAHPYPIDLHLANGGTEVSMTGTVQNPLNFSGAHVRLRVSGPDMEALYALTGIPIPHTPPFSVSGNVDYAKPRIRLTDLAGRVGTSDLGGSITETPGVGSRPDVTMDLASHKVDLTDLGGFVGTPAGRRDTPGETPSQERALASAESKKTLLPSKPLNIPRLASADIHLHYTGEHIINRYVPFDKLLVSMDIIDGHINLHPLDFTVGPEGRIDNIINLDPEQDKSFRVRLDTKFQHLELARLLQATHSFHGQGIIGGEAHIDTTGNSLAAMAGNGDGEVKLALLSGGDVSALLVDLAGLQFGNALLSALGLPSRTNIDCFVTDLPLHRGLLDFDVFLLDTNEGRVTGKGSLNFRDQMLDITLTTRAKHFSIGSLPGPINITGPLGDPSIRPGTEVVARAGAAAGLGILLTPLGALLPTIQFGIGNDNACTRAFAVEHEPLRETRPPRHRRRSEKRESPQT